jgi:3-oxoacyl-[acyl-carrier-protein] synthase II
MGVISPVGNDVETFWDNVKNGRSGVGPITRFDSSRLEAKIAAEVKDFDPSKYMDKKEARKQALFTQFAVAAAVQAWEQSGIDIAAIDPSNVATVIGNGIGGLEINDESHKKLLEAGPGRMLPMTVPLMISNEAAGNIAMRIGSRGSAFAAVTACASGTDAIGIALDMVRLGRCEVAICGGTEAAITEFALGGFCRLQALSTSYNDRPTEASRPFDKDRDGFVMGEGAGILVIETEEHAKKRGAKIIAELAGYGSTCDGYHLTAPDPEGQGCGRAIRDALADAGLSPEDVQYYNAHGTSTPVNDPIETKAVKLGFGEAHARKLKISSTKGVTGHCIAAAGALEGIICILAMRDGIVPPTINLAQADPECDLDYIPNVAQKVEVKAAVSASLGFGGHNAVIAFRRA